MKNLSNFFLSIIQKFIEIVSYIFSNNLNEKKYIKNKLSHDSDLVVFDVGANLGAYSKLLNDIFVNKNIFFHLFEPNKSLNQFINKRLKGLDYIVNNVAISDINGHSNFYINKISSQSSLVSKPNFVGKIENEIKISTLRLDTYIQSKIINKIDILKIDVEGSELKVLNSLGKILEDNLVKIIKIEIQFEERDNLQKIINFLNNFGYFLDGFTNVKYFNNKLLFVDAYFSAYKNEK